MDDRDRMDGRPMWVPWAMTSLVLLVVAGIAYTVGARHEVVVAGGEPIVHSSHFEFPGIFALFLLFWIFGGLRRMWWGGWYPYYRPWRYRRRYYAPDDDEREWEEWHRREHQRMEGSRGRGSSSSSSGPRGPSGGDNRDAGRD
jgi:hypothetical protein